MSDSACSNCDRECPCRDNSYDCWILEANRVKEHISSEQINTIRNTVAILQNIKDDIDMYEVANGIHALNQIIELYDEKETSVD